MYLLYIQYIQYIVLCAAVIPVESVESDRVVCGRPELKNIGWGDTYIYVYLEPVSVLPIYIVMLCLSHVNISRCVLCVCLD